MQEKDIFKAAIANNNFRKVLYTNEHSQVVLMSLKPGEEIGKEVHKVDQILIFVQGQGLATLNGEDRNIEANDLVVVPAGAEHNFTNTGNTDMKLYTIYAPAEHKPGTVHATKEEADADEDDHA